MNSKDLHNLSEAWNNITLSEEYLSEGQALNILEELGLEGYQELLECVEYLAEQESRIAPTGIGSDPRYGALGQLIRTIQKTGITGPAGRQAALDYDAAIAALRKNNPNAKPGALESDIATAAQVRQQMQSIRDKRAGSNTGGGSRPPAPVLTPQQIARQKANAEYQALRTKDPAAAKAAGDKAFAKFNPKLAAAAAERARIRGTAQTDNPLMRDMRSRLPQVTPSIQAPAVARLGAGNQSLVQNRNAIRGAAPKPVAPVAATAPITNRVATSYGSGAKPIVPIKPIQPVRPLPVARPVASTAYGPGLRLQHTDLFDIVKGHLMNEGATEKEALHMMANMNDEQREQINEKLIKLGKLSGRLAQKVMNRRAGDLLVGRAPKVRGYISKSIRSLDPDNITPARMSNVPGKVSGQGMGVRPMTLGPKPKAPLDPETRYKLIPGAKYGDTVMAAPGGKPPSSEYPRKIDLTDVKPLPGSKSKLLSQDELDKIRQRALEVGKKSKNKK